MIPSKKRKHEKYMEYRATMETKLESIQTQERLVRDSKLTAETTSVHGKKILGLKKSVTRSQVYIPKLPKPELVKSDHFLHL